MPEKTPDLIRAFGEQVMPWLHTLLLSVLAVFAQNASAARRGGRWVWREVLLDIVVCVFVGLVTHMLCEWYGMNGWGRSVMVALSAHMGPRALMQYERLRNRVLGLKNDNANSDA